MPLTRHPIHQRYLTTRCIRVLVSVTALALALILPSSAIAASAENSRQIISVTERLYQFTDGDAAGAFMLGDTTAVVFDPMNDSVAAWLNSEIQSRFNLTVSHVVYSSHLPQRTGGAQLFPDATIIAHANLSDKLQNSAEPPSIVFTESLTIRLDDQAVTLFAAGPSVTDDALVAHFPSENAMYAGDLVAIERLPGISADQLAKARASRWASSVERINRIDFVYLLTSHQGVGIQNDSRKHALFLRELVYRISRALAKGESVESIRNSVKMENYKHWDGYDTISQLVEATALALQAESAR